jgi:hypothetical protein
MKYCGIDNYGLKSNPLIEKPPFNAYRKKSLFSQEKFAPFPNSHEKPRPVHHPGFILPGTDALKKGPNKPKILC